MEGYVYILQSLRNDRYYIGSTSNVGRRLKEHNDGKTKSIRYARPWELVFKKKYSTVKEAKQVEFKLKKFKSKKIIEQIISDKDIIMGP